MSTCLGLYIEENIIKYAKVTKDRDQIKVDSFGVKFYDNLDKAIQQIVEETFSYKTPISINLSEEMYNFFKVFALLNKKDFPKAIETEFESYCTDKNYNPNVFETRYALTQDVNEKDKLKVIHVSENKMELNKNLQKFSSYKLQNITPTSMTISDIAKFDENEKCLVVNIEGQTTITTIFNQNIYDIQKLDVGMNEILSKINLKENSYQKAYEICKETTIYTSEGKELSEEETNYLEDIMPTLYDIVGKIKKILNENIEKIEKVYITGTGALINNIDLYFEEYLEDVRCEILKPGFIKMSPEINIKDYVEVNSAISLALSGLGEGISGMNFKKTSIMDKLPEILTMEVGQKKAKPIKQTNSKNKKIIDKKIFTMDLKMPLDKIERGMLRGTAGLLILFIVYCGFSNLIKKQIDTKTSETQEVISSINTQISLVNSDIQSLQNMKSKYTSKISNLEKISEKVQENNKIKKAIPILLNKLMYIMPDEVQITSIQNTTSTHIEIQAQSKSYSQLGYLTTNLKVSGALNNVISTAGQQSNNIITIKIEGDLP